MKTVFFTITSIFGHNSRKKGGIDLRLVLFYPDSCKLLDCDKKFQKKSIMADFGLKNCNFRTNFILLAVFFSNGCCISPGFAFITSVHINTIALWQKFSTKICNARFWPEKRFFGQISWFLPYFSVTVACKSPGFDYFSSVR